MIIGNEPVYDMYTATEIKYPAVTARLKYDRIVGSRGERKLPARGGDSETLGKVTMENITRSAAEQKSYNCLESSKQISRR